MLNCIIHHPTKCISKLRIIFAGKQIVCCNAMDTQKLQTSYQHVSIGHCWSPVANRGIYSISLVHPSVRPSQLISKTAPTIFLKFGMKLGIHKGSNVTDTFFYPEGYIARRGIVVGCECVRPCVRPFVWPIISRTTYPIN